MSRKIHFVFILLANAASGLCSLSERSEQPILLTSFIGVKPSRYIKLFIGTIP